LWELSDRTVWALVVVVVAIVLANAVAGVVDASVDHYALLVR